MQALTSKRARRPTVRGDLAVLVAIASAVVGARAARAQQTAVFVMAVDGSGVRKVAQVEGFQKNGYPRWSHDGRRLAFDAYDGPNREKKVFVVNGDGTALVEMGPHGAVPDWSPDDKQLAFESYGDGGVQTGSWVQTVDGKGRDWLVAGFSPRFSPDGSRLAYTDWHALVVRDLVDDSERNLLDRHWIGILAGFDWAPDGRRIALIGKRNDNSRALYVVGTAAGDADTLVLAGRELTGQVSWSPDGKRLAFSMDLRIHVLDPDNPGSVQAIAGQVGQNRDPAWSPDGKLIAFSSSRKQP